MRLILRLLPIILLVLYSRGQEQSEIKCEERMASFIVHSNDNNNRTDTVCTCVVIDKNTAIGQETKMAKSFNKIEAFNAEYKIFHVIPNEIGNRFRTIKYLTIRYSKLKRVVKGDLVKLGDLIYLDLSFNEIKMLEANLFDKNLKLKTIWVNNNEIYFIDSGILNNLYHLRFLSLNGNACYNGTAGNPSDAKSLIIKNTCEGKLPNIWFAVDRNFIQQLVNDLKGSLHDNLTKLSRRIEGNSITDQPLINNTTSTFDNFIKEVREGQVQALLLLGTTIGLFLLIVILVTQNLTLIFCKNVQKQAMLNHVGEETVTCEAVTNNLMASEPTREMTLGDNPRSLEEGQDEAIYSKTEVEQQQDFYEELPGYGNNKAVTYGSTAIYAEIHKK